MTPGKRPARLKLAAASSCAVLWLFVGCVDLSPPWDKAAGGAGGKGNGSGGVAGAGGAMIDGPSMPDIGHEVGNGGNIPAYDGGLGGAPGSDDGGEPPLPGSGGASESGTGGAGGLAVDGSVSQTGGAQGGAGGRNDASVSTGGIKGTGGVQGTGGRSNSDAMIVLDATSLVDSEPDAVEPGVEVSADLGPDLPPDAPIAPPDLGPDFGPDLGPDLGPDSAPDANPLLVGLVAYYKCDDTSGNTLSDSSGLGHHGTLNGGFTLGATGRVGSGLTLAKSGSGYVSVPTQVFAGRKNVTIATWFKVTTLDAWARIFDTGINVNASQAPAEGTKYMGLTAKSSNTNNLRWSISVNGFIHEESLNTSSATPTGVWQHVVVVLEESSAKGWLYINGSAVVSDEPTSIQPDDLGAIDYAFLGKSQFSVDPYFDGMLDEFRVYDRVLSASEVQALYQFTGP